MANKVTTLGHELLRNILPEDVYDPDMELDKKGLKKVLQDVAEKHPDRYKEIVYQLSDIGGKVSTTQGQVSFSLDDLITPPALKKAKQAIVDHVDLISQSDIPAAEKNKRIVSFVAKNRDKINDNLYNTLVKNNNQFADSIKNGYRGSPIQLTQLLYGDLLNADAEGNPIPIVGLHSYAEGVTPMEYFGGAYGARKGLWEVQKSTADVGYYNKLLALAADGLRITGDDCGAQNIGVPVSAQNSDLIGSVLAQDVGGFKANTVITKEVQKALGNKEVLVRSPTTCQQPDGLCKKCVGLRENGRFADTGAFVGIETARSVGEPITQAGLSSKHTGGLVGGAGVSGFEAAQQFTAVPKKFLGEAALSDLDGKVDKITKAPQGGWFVNVNGQSHYVPQSLEVSVKVGDTVEAGDILSSGMPNPRQVAQYKGVGEARQYFTQKFGEILKDMGSDTNERNIEMLSRGFFDRVKVNDEGGYKEYPLGSVLPYSYVQKTYKPRKTAETKSLQENVKDYYLEKPVLYYTIGTRITDKVANNLKKYGVNNVTVNKEPPPFEPHVVRLMDIPASHPDWRKKLAGFNLKKSIQDIAATGSESDDVSPSYVPGLMNTSLWEREALGD